MHCTVESFKFVGPVIVDYGLFAYLYGGYFVDASGFSSVRKLTLSKFVFVKDVYSWERAIY